MALSYPTHLIRVNSRYYYKIKVPADLSHLFPSRFIKKSLFTDQLKAAKTLLTSYEYRTHNAFELLRTGTLAQDNVQQLVNSLLPVPKVMESDKKKPEHKPRVLLKKVVETYTSEKQSGWTNKTKMEVAGVFRMLVELLGNVDVTTIDRPKLVELWSVLLKVPPGFYVKNRNGSVRDAVKKATGSRLAPARKGAGE